MHTTSRFLQGIYSFEGQGLCKPVPIDPALTYTVPPGVTGQALYFRGENTEEMITIVLVRDGQPMRFPDRRPRRHSRAAAGGGGPDQPYPDRIARRRARGIRGDGCRRSRVCWRCERTTGERSVQAYQVTVEDGEVVLQVLAR